MRCKDYRPLTPKAVLELAGPSTWGAGVTPVLLATALLPVLGKPVHPGLFWSLLLCSVLLQCAVNTLNDYADFVKGTDRLENSDDPEDASIIYNGIDPKSALKTGIVFIALAVACGIPALISAGPLLLIFGAIGVAVLSLYSLGPAPLSYRPVGELCSGLVMGGVIPLACWFAQTGELQPEILALALPGILSIGLIMLVNNGSDIQRDRAAGRRTLPVLLGRKRTQTLMLLWILAAAVFACLSVWRLAPGSLFLTPFLAAALALPTLRLWNGGLSPKLRMRSMQSVSAIHWRLQVIYIGMLLLGSVLGM